MCDISPRVLYLIFLSGVRFHVHPCFGVCVFSSCSADVLLKQQWGSKLSNSRLDKDHKNNIGNLKWTSWTFGLLELQLKRALSPPCFPVLLKCCGWQLSKGQSQSSLAFSQICLTFSLSCGCVNCFVNFFSHIVPQWEESKRLMYWNTATSCHCGLFWCHPVLSQSFSKAPYITLFEGYWIFLDETEAIIWIK